MDPQQRNPWEEIARLRREVDRMVGRLLGELSSPELDRPVAFSPRLDLLETDETVVVRVALPGVLEEDIDIHLSDGKTLIVRGERDAPAERPRMQRVLGEWSYGYFERIVQLPDPVSEEDLSASFENGVLEIRLHRAR